MTHEQTQREGKGTNDPTMKKNKNKAPPLIIFYSSMREHVHLNCTVAPPLHPASIWTTTFFSTGGTSLLMREYFHWLSWRAIRIIFYHNFCAKPYVPRPEPRRDPSVIVGSMNMGYITDTAIRTIELVTTCSVPSGTWPIPLRHNLYVYYYTLSSVSNNTKTHWRINKNWQLSRHVFNDSYAFSHK